MMRVMTAIIGVLLTCAAIPALTLAWTFQRSLV